MKNESAKILPFKRQEPIIDSDYFGYETLPLMELLAAIDKAKDNKMGWANGSEVAYKMIKVVQENVKDETVREVIYDTLIEVLEQMDCDTLSECIGIDPAYDKFFLEN